MDTTTEQATLHEQVSLGESLKRLNALPDYQKVHQYLFGTKPSDLMKALGMTELGSDSHKELVRQIDALSVVSLMLTAIATEAENAAEELTQLRTHEDE